MGLVPGLHLSTAKSSTYRNLRPAPLNMALVSGPHPSTSKSGCPLTPGEDARTCLSSHCGSVKNCRSISSRRTSADGESLFSFGVTDESRSVLLEAGLDVGSDLGSPSSAAHSEPPSPLDSMLVRTRRRLAMLQRTSRDGALELMAAEAHEPDAADHCEPPSPFDGARVLTRHRLAMLQEASHDKAAAPGAIEGREPDDVDYFEPSSPLDSLLLKAKRHHALTRGF